MGQQLAAQRAARVGAGEVFRLETARIEQGHGQGVAEGDLGRGAGRGGQVQRAGLFGHKAVEHDGGMAGQAGFGPSSHGDDGDAQALEHGQHSVELVALARVGQGQHHVRGRDHAEVAMAGLGRMHEQGRCAGGGQGGGDFAADMAALAHAHDGDPTAAGQHGLHRPGEAVAQARRHFGQGAGLDVQGLLPKAHCAGAVKLLWIAHPRQFNARCSVGQPCGWQAARPSVRLQPSAGRRPVPSQPCGWQASLFALRRSPGITDTGRALRELPELACRPPRRRRCAARRGAARRHPRCA